MLQVLPFESALPIIQTLHAAAERSDGCKAGRKCCCVPDDLQLAVHVQA